MEPKNTVPSLVPSYLSELGTRISAVANLYKDRKSAADAIGVSTDQLARYMRGENQPTLLGAANMALQVGISVEWLATGEGSMKAGESAPAQHPAKVDADMLRDCLDVMEHYLQLKSYVIGPEDKAGFTAALYSYAQAMGAADKSALTDFLKLVVK